MSNKKSSAIAKVMMILTVQKVTVIPTHQSLHARTQIEKTSKKRKLRRKGQNPPRDTSLIKLTTATMRVTEENQVQNGQKIFQITAPRLILQGAHLRHHLNLVLINTKLLTKRKTVQIRDINLIINHLRRPQRRGNQRNLTDTAAWRDRGLPAINRTTIKKNLKAVQIVNQASPTDTGVLKKIVTGIEACHRQTKSVINQKAHHKQKEMVRGIEVRHGQTKTVTDTKAHQIESPQNTDQKNAVGVVLRTNKVHQAKKSRKTLLKRNQVVIVRKKLLVIASWSCKTG